MCALVTGVQTCALPIFREAPWQVVVFSLGMHLVVYGLRNEGLTDHVATLLDLFAGYGVWGATFGTGLLIAFLSSVMNNMPTVLVGALSLDASHAEGIVQNGRASCRERVCQYG